MKWLFVVSFMVLTSCSLTSTSISEMKCYIAVQKKAGGENPSVKLEGSEVRASDYKDDTGTLVSSYQGQRFHYVVYATKKHVPDRSDVLLKFSDKQEGFWVWTHHNRKDAESNIVVAINEHNKEEPIYYLHCETK